MKFTPFLFLLILPNTYAKEGTWTATKYGAAYAGTVIADNAGEAMGAVQDAAHAAYVPTREAAGSAWGYVLDVKDGMVKRSAISNGDGVAINASVYAMSLRQAERENKDLKQLQKDREKRQYDLKRATEETERLQKLATEYVDLASKFQSNISETLNGIAESAQKLEGFDKAHQDRLQQILDQHKKLGALTAEDGKSRVGQQALVSMKEALVDLEDFARKSPEAAAKAGLTMRLAAMSSMLEGAQERFTEKEDQIEKAQKKINELSAVDESKVALTEQDMQRNMILGSLNNSVSNLITNGEFSRVRSQLAFSHFNEIEKEMKEKGVKAGDVKKAYKDHMKELADQYNNTPLGVFVNGQIAKAMGTVCEFVNNQCKDGTNNQLFDFLDDTSRGKFKIVMPETPTADPQTVTTPK